MSLPALVLCCGAFYNCFWLLFFVPVSQTRASSWAKVFARLPTYGSATWSLVTSAVTGDARGLSSAVCCLGPCAIKIGQSLAARPDLVGQPVALQLQDLQNNVPPSLDFEEIVSMLVDAGFDTSINMSTLSKKPIAAASLAQVHKASLFDGSEVAVKIQRPGLQDILSADLFLLRQVAYAVQPLFKANVVEAVQELSTRMWEETDMINEAENLKLFRSLYDHQSRGGMRSGGSGISTPLLYSHLSNDKILTMSFISGQSLVQFDRIPKDQLLKVTSLGIRCTLSQLFQTGVLHADPHGGNIIYKDGSLVYLDFGLISRVPKSVRTSLLCAVIYFVQKDFNSLACEFDGLMLLSKTDIENNADRLAKALEQLVNQIFAFGPDNLDDDDILSRLPILKFDSLISSLSSIASEFPFTAPPYFLNNIRALGTLEGMALSADPSFNLFRIVYPFMIATLFDELDDPKIQKTFYSLLLNPVSGLVNWRKAQRLVKEARISGLAPFRLAQLLIATKGGRNIVLIIFQNYFHSWKKIASRLVKYLTKLLFCRQT